MKTIITIIALLTLSISLWAQNAILHSASGVQYFAGTSAFDKAYTASVSGDTIFLSGGGFTAPATIDKSLLVIGAGHYPDSTKATRITQILNGFTLNENADGFHIEGVKIIGNLAFGNNQAVDNVIIRYCHITGFLNVQGDGITAPCLNLTIANNYLNNSIALNNTVLAGVYNNLIGRNIVTNSNTLGNNIFLTNEYIQYIEGNNNTIENNIFLYSQNNDGYGINGSANTINNNIFVRSTPKLGTVPEASGNWFGVDQSTIFINQSGFIFSYEHDYHLQSPETYLGTDYSQIGIYGGTFVYKEGALPSNPHIQSATIAPSSTNEGLLNIEINAVAQDE